MFNVVDFEPFNNWSEEACVGIPTAAQKLVAEQINCSFRDHGFMYLRNYGLSPSELEKMYAVGNKLFALPEQYKRTKLKQIDVDTNPGYVPFAREILNPSQPSDLKEVYNFKHPRVQPYDYAGCPAELKELAEWFRDRIHIIAMKLAAACAIALDLPLDFFSSSANDSRLTTFRLAHYPPCKFAAGISTGETLSEALRVGEHVDFGLFTFLFTDGPGLQVKGVKGAAVGGEFGGELDGWNVVPVPEFGTAIVNTGALLARWTNDYWQAAAHRVIVRDGMEGARYTMACFFQPHEDAMVEVHKRFLDKEGTTYEGISSLDFFMMKLREVHKLNY